MVLPIEFQRSGRAPSASPGHPGLASVAPAGTAAPDIEILEVTKRFGAVTAVDSMTLTIARGAFYSFLGPSGCGKTTTLRMIAGFEQPDSGEILLQGQPIAGVPPYRRNVNTVWSSNFLDAVLVDHEPATGRATVETSAGLRIGGEVTDRDARPAAGEKVTVAIRPERLRVEAPSQGEPSSPEAGWLRTPGRIAQGTYLGDQTEYRVETQALGNLIIRCPNDAGDGATRTFGPGEAVVVTWPNAANLVLMT